MKLKELALLIVGLSTQATYAGTMGKDCNTSHVETPCESTAWNFGGRALYLQAAYSNLPGSVRSRVVDRNGQNPQEVGVAPGYGWGFFLEGSYHFDQGKDANLNFYYIDNTFKQSNPLAQGGSFSASLKPSWAAANFELGQELNIGEISSMRIHGGVQYARLYTHADFSQVVNLPNFLGQLRASGSGQYVTGFNGFGPRVGIDLGYKLTNWADGFRIYLNGAAGLLAGTSKANFFISRLGGESRSMNQVVPELDTKIGLDYTRMVWDNQLTFDAGWMWVDYLSVLYQNNTGNGDLSFQGLYFGLKWLGNFA